MKASFFLMGLLVLAFATGATAEAKKKKKPKEKVEEVQVEEKSDPHSNLLACSNGVYEASRSLYAGSYPKPPVVGERTKFQMGANGEEVTISEIRSGAGAPGFNVVVGDKSYYLPATKGNSHYSLMMGDGKTLSFIFDDRNKKFGSHMPYLEPDNGRGKVFVLSDPKDLSATPKTTILKQRPVVQSECVKKIMTTVEGSEVAMAELKLKERCDKMFYTKTTNLGEMRQICGESFNPRQKGIEDEVVLARLRRVIVKKVHDEKSTSIGSTCDKLAFNIQVATPLAAPVTSGPEHTEEMEHSTHVFYGKGPKSNDAAGFWSVTPSGAYFIPNNAQKNYAYLGGNTKIELDCTFGGLTFKSACSKKPKAQAVKSIGDDQENKDNATNCVVESKEVAKDDKDFTAACKSEPTLDNYKNTAPFPEVFKASLRRQIDQLLLDPKSRKTFVDEILRSDPVKERMNKCISEGVISQDVMTALISTGLEEDNSSEDVPEENVDGRADSFK